MRKINTMYSAGKLGLFDRLMGVVSPSALIKRGQNQLASLYVRNHLKRAAYKSAETTRLNEHWSTANEDINLILQRELDKMRARSRWLLRNNAHAMGMMNAYISHIIGTGLNLQCRVASKVRSQDAEGNVVLDTVERDAWNDYVEDMFDDWCEYADVRSTELVPETFHDDEELFLRRLIEDGEVFVYLGLDDTLPGNIPLRLMFVEPESLDLMITESNGNPVVLGVEVDKSTFRPLAYHIQTGLMKAGVQVPGKSLRVTADQMIHVYKRVRPKQVRGIPHLAVVMQKFFDLDEWTDAELLGNKIAACFGVIIETPDGTGVLSEEGDASKMVDADGNPLSTIEPGMVGFTGEGSKVHAVSPQKPGATFDMFAKYQLKGIGAGTLGGISYPAMTRDTSGQTFAGGRLSQQMDHQAFKPFQNFVARKFCSPIYRRWLRLAVLAGEVQAPGYFRNPSYWERHEFLPPGWMQGINPKQDIDAAIGRMSSGITTLADECGYLGKDWRRQLLMAAKIKRMADHEGLTLKGINDTAAPEALEDEADPEAQELLSETA